MPLEKLQRDKMSQDCAKVHTNMPKRRATETTTESKDQCDLKRIRQKQAEASRRYRQKKKAKPSISTAELTLSSGLSSSLMKEVAEMRQKLAESEAAQSELQTQSHEAAIRLKEAEEKLTLASQIIKQMKAELENSSCKATLGVRRKAKALQKNDAD